MPIFRSTKTLKGYPCTHRQWKAESHCRFIHGYSREFYFEFESSSLTPEMWVMDFGGLKEVKKWLAHMFDHTFLAAKDDPELSFFKELDKKGIIQLRTLPNVGMEGTAEYVYHHIAKMIGEQTQNRVWITKVIVSENEKNSAIYIPDPQS